MHHLHPRDSEQGKNGRLEVTPARDCFEVFFFFSQISYAANFVVVVVIFPPILLVPVVVVIFPHSLLVPALP